MTSITYIMGYGRSGSTFYESLLQTKDGLNGFGEIKYLAERGAVKNELCGCGEPAQSCPFWREIISELSSWDFGEIERVTEKLESSIFFFANVILAKLGKLDSEIELYQSFNDRLYELLAQDGPFIDSSKMPARAYFLSIGRDSVFENIVWFVRDPRGVAWSCMKEVERPEATTEADSQMPKFGYFSSIGKWSINTLVAFFVANRFSDSTEVRHYELMGEELGSHPARVQPEGYRSTFHSVSGNPRRFTGGLARFKLDTEWEKSLTRQQKRSAQLLTLLPRSAISRYENSAKKLKQS